MFFRLNVPQKMTNSEFQRSELICMKQAVFNTFAETKFDCHGSPHRPLSKP